MANSPLIANGVLSLSPTGDLMSAPDIQTQMTVAIGAYHCIYDNTVDSLLIPYLSSIPIGGFKNNTITNIVVNAYKPMITANLITNLQVAILAQVLSNLTIKVSAIDNQGNSAVLSWSNAI